jgi:pimeloyl-ACP methyl ester carboxylesterase
MTDSASILSHVASKDGTTIGYDRLGDGPPVILVSGGSVDRRSNAGLAAILASDFTVFNYDRRGRGDSGDILPYAIEREIEDIDAVVGAAGGRAHIYGTSSGAGLAFEAARRLGNKITRLAMWEPPYVDDPAARPPADQVVQYDRMLAEGRRSDMAEFFMAQVVRMPPDFVAWAKTQPFWADQEKIAHTLAYDARIMGDYSLPIEQAAKLTVPTIVIAGGASVPFLPETARMLGAALPNGRTEIIPGQDHNVAPEAIAPVLKEFFAD